MVWLVEEKTLKKKERGRRHYLDDELLYDIVRCRSVLLYVIERLLWKWTGNAVVCCLCSKKCDNGCPPGFPTLHGREHFGLRPSDTIHLRSALFASV